MAKFGGLFGLQLFVSLVVISSGAESETQSETVDDIIQDAIDSLIQDLEERYSEFEPDEFWHPYVFGTGNENREVLHVRKVDKTAIPGDYIQWKYARLGLKHYLVGLTEYSIDVLGSEFQKIDTIISMEELKAVTVFTRWNDENSQAEMVIVTVTTELQLNVHVFDNQVIRSIGKFPLHYSVQSIELCHVGSSYKIVIIPENMNVDIDIYNINSTQVWFFQRIPSSGDSRIVVYDSDQLDSIIAVSGKSQLSIYTYDSKAGLFDINQAIPLPNPCQRLFSFTLGYQTHIGCVPTKPDAAVRFVSYNYNANEYIVEGEDSTFGNILTTDVFPIAVSDYTDQYFMLIQDAEGVTRIVVYHGRQAGFQIEYNCTVADHCPTTLDLSHGVSFPHKEDSAYVFPSAPGTQSSEVWLIAKEIRDSLSPLVDESRQLYNNYYELAQRFEKWDKGVIAIEKVLNNSIKTNEPNTITSTWTLNNLNTSHLLLEQSSAQDIPEETIFKEFKFANSHWSEQDFETDIPSTNDLMTSLKISADIAQIELDDAVLATVNSLQRITAQQYVSGKFQTPKLAAVSLTSRAIGDIPVEEFLESFVLKTDEIELDTFIIFDNSVNVSQLHTSKLNEIQVSHIARYSYENVFQCLVQFNSGLKVNGSVIASTINGVDLSKEVMLASNISGLNFTDGFVVTNDTKSKGLYSFDKVLLKSSDQVVHSHVHFPEIQTASPIDLRLINGYSFNEFVTSVITNDYPGVIFGRKHVAEIVSAKSLNIGATWNHFSFPNGLIRNKQNRIVLNGTKVFNLLTSNKVTVEGLLDGLKVEEFIPRNSPQELRAPWTFAGPVVVIKDLPVSGLVDGVDMKELANKGTLNEYTNSYIAYADVEFEQEIIVDNLHVKSTINDRDFRDAFGDLLLFNGTTCEIPGLTTVDTNVTLDSLSIGSNAVNSVLLNNFFTTNGNQNISADFTIAGPCQFGALYALELYDNVDLRSLLQHAIRLTGTNNITWKANFEDMRCGESMSVESPINNVEDFYSSVAVISGRASQKFYGAVQFEKVSWKSATVYKHLNISNGSKVGGIDIELWNNGRMSLSKNEYFVSEVAIERVKAFKDIHIDSLNNVSLSTLAVGIFRTDILGQVFTQQVTFEHPVAVVNGTVTFGDDVSGYNLNNIVNDGFPLNGINDEWLELNGYWHFEDIAIEDSLRIHGKTCGVDLDELDNDSVRKGQSGIRISGKKVFHDLEVQRAIQTNGLNQRNPDDLFTLHTNQQISCPFNNKKNIWINGSFDMYGTLNGISTEELFNAHSLDHDAGVHTIDGDYTSEYNITMDNLKVRGHIQGQTFLGDTSSFINTDDPNLKFSAEKTFSNAVLIMGDSNAELYNSISPDSIVIQRLSDDMLVESEADFRGTVHADVVQVLQGDVGSVNVVGLDWETMIKESIPVNSNLHPMNFANLTFDNIIVDHHLSTKLFQGHRFDDFVLLDGPQHITYLRVLKAKIHGPNIPVSNFVQGYNLNDELDKTLMINDEDQIYQLGGKKSFRGTLIVEGDVSCFGPEFKNQVVDITKPFHIGSPIEFTKPLYIDKSLQVTKPVQGHTVDDIVAEALTQEDNEDISGQWEFTKGVTFKDDVYGPGELQNFNLQGLIDQKNIEIRAAGSRIERQKKRFREECLKVHNITEDLVSNPMKLDAFDKHQSIILRKQVDKVVTIRTSEKLFLLTTSSTCETVRYEWKNSTELFYKDILGQNEMRFGHIKEWQSTTVDTSGLLVFTIEPSQCSLLSQGVHYSLILASGLFSPPHPVLLGEDKGFKLITDPEMQQTAVFLINSGSLHAFIWNSQEYKFAVESVIQLDKDYDRIEVTGYLNGVGILLCADDEVSIFHYVWSTKVISLVAKEQFLTNSASPPALFESYDILYALVPQSGMQLSEPQAASSVQVFSVVDNVMTKFHQLPLNDVISKSITHFAEQIFVSFLSKTYGLNIFQFKGLSGLQRLNENPIKLYNGLEVLSFDVKAWKYSVPRPFILVLTSTTIEVFHSNVFGDSLDHKSKNLCRLK